MSYRKRSRKLKLLVSTFCHHYFPCENWKRELFLANITRRKTYCKIKFSHHQQTFFSYTRLELWLKISFFLCYFSGWKWGFLRSSHVLNDAFKKPREKKIQRETIYEFTNVMCAEKGVFICNLYQSKNASFLY